MNTPKVRECAARWAEGKPQTVKPESNPAQAAPLLDEIASLGRAIMEASKRRTEAMNEWANLVSTLKVGDVTEGRGYTFTGKRVCVTLVSGRLHYGDGQPRVRIDAVVLKSDGSSSKHFTDWTEAK